SSWFWTFTHWNEGMIYVSHTIRKVIKVRKFETSTSLESWDEGGVKRSIGGYHSPRSLVQSSM
ncbi:hypothetical protein BD311DRAFT_764870, partial [Dichomitus squalens]